MNKDVESKISVWLDYQSKKFKRNKQTFSIFIIILMVGQPTPPPPWVGTHRPLFAHTSSCLMIILKFYIAAFLD